MPFCLAFGQLGRFEWLGRRDVEGGSRASQSWCHRRQIRGGRIRALDSGPHRGPCSACHGGVSLGLLSVPEGVKVIAVRRRLRSYYTGCKQCCLFGTHNRPEKDLPSIENFI